VPRTADPDVRVALIDAAARLIAAHAPLTSRRLAEETGVSTMAVYTHFGSMDDLRRAVRSEGFGRLAARLDHVPVSSDPVADLTASGVAYVAGGLADPNMYRVMFFEAPLDSEDSRVAAATFAPVIETVERCLRTERFTGATAEPAAVQLWAVSHGLVSAVIAGLIDGARLTGLADDLTERLYVGFGDTRAAARRSIRRAQRWGRAQGLLA
jgi:AcrR family transcriptional regulator